MYGAEVRGWWTGLWRAWITSAWSGCNWNLGWMAVHRAAHGDLDLSHALRQQLEAVSISTVRNGRDSAPGRIRTCDLQFRRLSLYPLSYWGNCLNHNTPRACRQAKKLRIASSLLTITQ